MYFRSGDWLTFQDFILSTRKRILNALDIVDVVVAIFGVLLIIYDFGYQHTPVEDQRLFRIFNVVLFLLLVGNIADHFLRTFHKTRKKFRAIDVIVLILLFLVLEARVNFTGTGMGNFISGGFFSSSWALYILIAGVFVLELSELSLIFSTRNTNPAILFMASFFFLIATCTGLLMLPVSTHTGISLTDAAFTATSAVCVTGLIVVDTATYYTFFGQVIIIIFIQLGGLGIMTFASFFGYVFKGGSSFGNEFLLSELFNDDNRSQIFRTLGQIIFITFTIEAIGLYFIYLTSNPDLFDSTADHLWFSLFHSVSAFCNAGFSTLSNSFYEPGFRNDYDLHIVIGMIVVMGGLGFPVVYNYYAALKRRVKGRFTRRVLGKPYHYVPNLISLNTHLVVRTTLLLIIGGFAGYLFYENNSTLEGVSTGGRLAESFFTSVIARTAGFNIVDMQSISLPTVMLLIILMWIGASPASTGGGIKTTTFAISVLNAFSVARGKDRVEFKGREISKISIKKASAIVLLSIIAVFITTMVLLYTESGSHLDEVLFEVVSAYGTVGLSLNFTPHLSETGRWIIILSMFLGRVGIFTLLVAILKQLSSLHYQLPSEKVNVI